MSMSLSSYKAYRDFADAERRELVGAHSLADESREQTLMYGYTLARHTVHVYHQRHWIHRFVYDGSLNVIEYKADAFWLPEDLIKDEKRWYPESCKQSFVWHLARLGVKPCFTTYDEVRYEKIKDERFQGLVYG